MKRIWLFVLLATISCVSMNATTKIANIKVRNTKSSTLSIELNKAIAKHTKGADSVILNLEGIVYNLYPNSNLTKELYISNHDQVNPKNLGILLEGLKNVTIDGHGAELLCHGRMLPIAILNCQNVTLKNISIDFETPHITQVTIIENDTVNGEITYRPAPWVKYKIDDNGHFIVYGDGWQHKPVAGMAFDGTNNHVLYRTSDIGVGTDNVVLTNDGNLKAPWRNSALVPGVNVAMRNYDRPAPAIFVDQSNHVCFENVNVHYAEGMGLLAQVSSDLNLDGFSVKLKEGSARCFTTQADATHFSGCRGEIRSVGGTYEGMMDDAINVHGTYLKIVEMIDSSTVVARYMHPQSYGFFWGEKGDSIRLISSVTMDALPEAMIIKEIVPNDALTIKGSKEYKISFTHALPINKNDASKYGLENLTWTPSVLFSDNLIRNNRARGSLFSTPKRVEACNNTYDHTSGSAILLSGDCNGWYETGACTDVYIHHNHFINALTSMYQFTNAVISIYPEIPNLKNQSSYFHSGIKIVDNTFETFDFPLLYAKSVDGLVFLNNIVIHNNDFEPYHNNNVPIFLERVTNAKLQ